MHPRPVVQAFFDPGTSTVTYVVSDPESRRAAVIDPVLDFDMKSGRTWTRSIERVQAHVKAHELQVEWILETHAHADHLSAAWQLKQRIGGAIAIGEHIREVQGVFKTLFHLGEALDADGSQFDHLFRDGEVFHIGGIEATVLHVPGHTPADLAYRVGDCVFVGDTMFMPDVGTARADFPGGDATALYRSIRKLLELPRDTRVFVCHDYPPDGRGPAWETTIGEQQDRNIHVRDGVTEQAFVTMRTARDATLEVPTLILPSLQVNIRAGRLPEPEANGVSYLKVPLNGLSQ
ncbi:MBL fold metallo-hydrolase [Roseateles sp. MS654]|uniref:MBL fold metallo-hydrolase n=1 Tax=Roseateles sp. MS654 TaxID=3412685 RepID=UPI003C2D7A8F